MKDKKYKFYKKIKIKNRNRKLYVKRKSKSRKLYIKHHKKMVEYKKYIKKQHGGLWNPFKRSKTLEELYNKKNKLLKEITEAQEKMEKENIKINKYILKQNISDKERSLEKTINEIIKLNPDYKKEIDHNYLLRESDQSSKHYHDLMQNPHATQSQKLYALEKRQDALSKLNVNQTKMDNEQKVPSYHQMVEEEDNRRTLQEVSPPRYTSSPQRIQSRPKPPTHWSLEHQKREREKERVRERINSLNDEKRKENDMMKAMSPEYQNIYRLIDNDNFYYILRNFDNYKNTLIKQSDLVKKLYFKYIRIKNPEIKQILCKINNYYKYTRNTKSSYIIQGELSSRTNTYNKNLSLDDLNCDTLGTQLQHTSDDIARGAQTLIGDTSKNISNVGNDIIKNINPFNNKGGKKPTKKAIKKHIKKPKKPIKKPKKPIKKPKKPIKKPIKKPTKKPTKQSKKTVKKVKK